MKLNSGEIRAVYYVMAGYRRASHHVPPSVDAFYRRLDRVVRAGELSSARQRSGCVPAQSENVELIGSRLAADMLGWHGDAGLRRVQRHAADLGGETVGGRLVFRAETVKQYRDALERG